MNTLKQVAVGQLLTCTTSSCFDAISAPLVHHKQDNVAHLMKVVSCCGVLIPFWHNTSAEHRLGQACPGKPLVLLHFQTEPYSESCMNNASDLDSSQDVLLLGQY